MIHVKHLSKRFGETVALKDVSFHIREGEVVGLLGPNGAGKTTLLRILSGFLAATSGSVTIGGLDVFHDSCRVRRILGYLPENVALYPEMRVRDYLRFRAKLKGVRGKAVESAVDHVAEACGLTTIRTSVIGRLSRGHLQRVGLADALVHDPDFLILDEPTVGLDPRQVRQIRQVVQGVAGRHTVLLASHVLHEVELICDRVLIISGGEIVASDTPENLVGLMRGNMRIFVEVRAPADRVVQRMKLIPGVARVTTEGSGEWLRLMLETEKDAEICRQVYRVISDNLWELRELKAEKQSLEDVFLEMTAA